MNYLGQEGREVVSKSQDHVSAQNVSQSSSSKLKRKSSESSSSSPSSSSSVVPEKKSALSIQLNASKVSQMLWYKISFLFIHTICAIVNPPKALDFFALTLKCHHILIDTYKIIFLKFLAYITIMYNQFITIRSTFIPILFFQVKTKNEPLKKPKVASVFNNDSEVRSYFFEVIQ